MTRAERLRAWRAANPEKAREQGQRAYEKAKARPGFAEANRARVAKWQKANAEYVNARHRGAVDPRIPPSRVVVLADQTRVVIEEKEKFQARARVRRKSGVLEADLTGESRIGPCINAACDYVGQLHFDHHKQSGRFRGWLCPNCNKSLGLMAESPARLRGLADYQEKFLTTQPDDGIVKGSPE